MNIKKDLKKGYDLVRWGNIEGVAIFHSRRVEMTDERVKLFEQIVVVLKAVCKVWLTRDCSAGK